MEARLALWRSDGGACWDDEQASPRLLHETEDETDPYVLRVLRQKAHCYEMQYEHWTMRTNTKEDSFLLQKSAPSHFDETYVFERLARPLFGMLRASHIAVHASALCVKTRGLAFMGDAFAGKSTLAMQAMALSPEAQYYCDDLLCLNARAQMLPSSSRAYLRTDLTWDFAEYRGELFSKHCYTIAPDRRGESLNNLSDVIFIRRGSGFCVDRLGNEDLFQNFMQHVFDFSPGCGTWRRHRFLMTMGILRQIPRSWYFEYPRGSLEDNPKHLRTLFEKLGLCT